MPKAEIGHSAILLNVSAPFHCPLMQPAAEVVSGLYPHQAAALAWMVERENSNALPPFWCGARARLQLR